MNFIKKIFKSNRQNNKKDYNLTQLACFHSDKVSTVTNSEESIVTLECVRCSRIYSNHIPHSDFYKENIYPYLQNINK